MKKTIAFGASVLSLALAGCGGSSSSTTTTPSPPSHKATIKQECPSGQSFMGCSQTGTPAGQFQQQLKQSTRKALSNKSLQVAPTGSTPMFPDVSNWQGTVGWGSVGAWQKSHGWPQGGVFKMGESGFRDSTAGNNARQLAALHYYKSGYWFVRAINCTAEANDIIGAAHDYGVTLVDEDLEVSEARGYGQCLTPKLRAAGLKVTEYTSPGANPGGVDTSAPLWQATFGSSFSPVWHPVVAWQCTDGVSGCRTFVPGIGFDDVSKDYGFSKLASPKPPPPPDPFAVMDKSAIKFGKISFSEYNTAKTFATHKCTIKSRNGVCTSSVSHLKLLTGRLWFIAHNHRDSHGIWHPNKATWGINHRGTRFKIMWTELHKTK